MAQGGGQVIEAFLACALMLPGAAFNHSPIVSYHAIRNEQDQLIAWLRKNNPGADVYIHERPQVDKLKNAGYEKVPFTHRGREIWIQRKPRTDQKLQSRMETSA